ncbi:helix-turn-helix domain-containing protein [Marimonas lutisalis]|uniref:helix-turn-helix domain-containing protein n=1 Tax=Marimonas lutisalis TaxID=2545756 RepID=UPI0010F75D3A|nr:helix-turn-helix domain-containing protein [Marimonas lutisalis]
MIGRKSRRNAQDDTAEPKWFDDYDLRLGDVMRGERATMGKSLLDVQRDLRIKASYIAAIENSDPTAFDTPGFIAGYVRSYARYLNMDPDKAYAAFCAESGFTTAHGMSAAASTIRKSDEPGRGPGLRHSKLGRSDADPLLGSRVALAPVGDSAFSRIEPRAVGSMLVLVALIGALGFGGWTVLNEVQRVQVAPVEHTPNVLADLDPLEGAAPVAPAAADDVVASAGAGVFTPPADALDRLYRPQALDVPVMVARDAPISTLDPATIGTFAGREVAQSATPGAPGAAALPVSSPQVIEEPAQGVMIFAVRPAWVRVRAGDGSIIFEKILEAGEEYQLPPDLEAPTLQAGMSGSLYFEIDGELFGPAGQGTATVRQLPIARDALLASYEPADLSRDPELAKIIALADAQTVQQPQE